MFALVLVKMIKIKKETIELMNALEKHYNQTHFIELDPVSIPHQFSKRQDIEIAGLFAAVFAWGQRVTILSKANNLLQRMDNSPHDFIINHTDKNNWAIENPKEDDVFIDVKRIDDVPGTHSVYYNSDVDFIEIKHVAHNREGFALGAIIAAEWIIGKKGVFSMKDVLNLDNGK
jgi:hypothetical protein